MKITNNIHPTQHRHTEPVLLCGDLGIMALRKVFDGQTALRQLNGIINVYKPEGVSVRKVRNAILSNLSRDLNELGGTRSSPKLTIGSGNATDTVAQKLNLLDNELTMGPRFQLSDIRCSNVASLGHHTSGVLLFGINRHAKLTPQINENRPVRVYHVTGKFGYSTESHFNDSRLTAKSSYNHINSDKLAGLTTSIQASHQRKMYELCGVDLQSQAAYEIASKGLIRPANNSQPVLYGIKLIDLKGSLFTLEIHAINENEQFLGALINDIGIELRSVAHCRAIRCIRHSHFSVEHSLLRRHWTLSGVFQNMSVTEKILVQHPSILKCDNVQLTV